jgi:hypothetical protein
VSGRNALAWVLGLGGALLFAVAFWGNLQNGHRVAAARAMMAGQDAVRAEPYAAVLGVACDGAAGCGPVEARACLKPPLQAGGMDGEVAPLSPGCNTAWKAGFATQALAGRVDVVVACKQGYAAPGCRDRLTAALAGLGGGGGPRGLVTRAFVLDPGRVAATGTFGLAAPMVLMMGGIVLLLAGLGLGTTGSLIGALVSPQNRLSLSLVQIAAWTAVIVAAYGTFAVFNIGLMAGHYLDIWNPVTGAAGELAFVFPSIPGWGFAVLGITLASPLASVLIKARKDPEAMGLEPAARRGARSAAVPEAKLATRAAPREASLADLFMGEEETNASRVDLSRVQHVLFTAILLAGYLGYLLAMLRGIDGAQVLDAVAGARPLLASLPDPGGVYAAMLAVTHGTYLVAKALPKPG